MILKDSFAEGWAACMEQHKWRDFKNEWPADGSCVLMKYSIDGKTFYTIDPSFRKSLANSKILPNQNYFWKYID